LKAEVASAFSLQLQLPPFALHPSAFSLQPSFGQVAWVLLNQVGSSPRDSEAGSGREVLLTNQFETG
jgi:hypothetical protein